MLVTFKILVQACRGGWIASRGAIFDPKASSIYK